MEAAWKVDRSVRLLQVSGGLADQQGMPTLHPVDGRSRPRVRRLRSILLACSTFLVVLLGGAAPASASHLQGGFFTANITSSGHLQGTLTYLEVYTCPSGVGSQKSLNITITSPTGQVVSKAVPTAATRCLSGGSTYEGSFDYALDASTFSNGAPDGAYTLEWTAGNRIFGISNLTNSGNKSVRFRAKVRKVTGVATGAPFLGSDIATGIGIGDLYSQNLNASDPDDVLGNGTLTYEALTGDPDLAPDTNVIDTVKLQANGQVEIPTTTTSGMANNSYYVYKVRVTDDQGDFAERDVLLRAVTPNHPPVINGLDTSSGYDINAGATQTINFTATDPDSANTVAISGAGLPSWAVLTPTPGNPAQAQLVLSPPAGANTRTYRLNFDAVDNDSNQALTGSRTIEVRVHGTPETQLLTWPASQTTSTSASFTFAAADPGYTFECSIDGGTTWDPCSSPKSYTGLADGVRTFKCARERRRERRPDARELFLDDRQHRAHDDLHHEARRSDDLDDRELRLLDERERSRDLPVQPRRRTVHELHDAEVLHGPCRRQSTRCR